MARDAKDVKEVFVIQLEKESLRNEAYRRVINTNKHQQLVLMHLKAGEEIGKEVHHKSSQFIRIEQGDIKAIISDSQSAGEKVYELKAGDSISIPNGVYHNIVATKDAKLYTIYSPPVHKDNLIQLYKNKKQDKKKDKEWLVANTYNNNVWSDIHESVWITPNGTVYKYSLKKSLYGLGINEQWYLLQKEKPIFIGNISQEEWKVILPVISNINPKANRVKTGGAFDAGLNSIIINTVDGELNISNKGYISDYLNDVNAFEVIEIINRLQTKI